MVTEFRSPSGLPKDHLALSQLAVVRQRKSGQLPRVDFDYRQIEFFRYANNLSGGNTGTRGKRRLERAPDLGIRQNDFDALRPADHMRIRHDVSALVDHKTGSDRPLPPDNRVGVAVVGFLEGAVARDQNLHHARGNSLDERVDRLV